LVLGVTVSFTGIVFGGMQTRQYGPEKTSVVVVMDVDNRHFLDYAGRRRDVRGPGQGTILSNDEPEGGHGVQYKVAASGIEVMNGQIQLAQQPVEVEIVSAGDVLRMTGEMCRYVLSTRFRLSRHGGVGACKDANRSKTRDSR